MKSVPVLVLGLGNPILTDDGVGVMVAEAVRAAMPPHAPVTVEEVSVGGLALMERMAAYRHVVLVDAVLSGSAPVGSVSRMTVGDLPPVSRTEHSWSPHDADLATALALGRSMGLELPSEIVIIGIEVENVLDFGETPTPAVSAAIPTAVRAVRQELRRWGALPSPNGGGGRRVDSEECYTW
jgi:hydrogenase maturation protease